MKFTAALVAVSTVASVEGLAFGGFGKKAAAPAAAPAPAPAKPAFSFFGGAKATPAPVPTLPYNGVKQIAKYYSEGATDPNPSLPYNGVKQMAKYLGN